MVHQKHDANGNQISRSNQNPILNTHLSACEVGFPGCKMTKLAANVIAEPMYSQCDLDGNEYLFLESFVDYKKLFSSSCRESESSSKRERDPKKVDNWLGHFF